MKQNKRDNREGEKGSKGDRENQTNKDDPVSQACWLVTRFILKEN